jgi:hypothetical protein
MTVVMTSNPRQPSSGAEGHRDALHRLAGEIIGALAEPSAPADKRL